MLYAFSFHAKQTNSEQLYPISNLSEFTCRQSLSYTQIEFESGHFYSFIEWIKIE